MKYLSPSEVSKSYMDKKISDALRTPRPEFQGWSAGTQYYGFEVEIEGAGCQRRAERLGDRWRLVRDGSLRGESVETIFRRPLSGDESEEAFKDFEKNFSKFGDSTLSERTSVHCHYDVSGKTMADLQKMLVAFFMFENALTRVAGGKEIGRAHV